MALIVKDIDKQVKQLCARRFHVTLHCHNRIADIDGGHNHMPVSLCHVYWFGSVGEVAEIQILTKNHEKWFSEPDTEPKFGLDP